MTTSSSAGDAATEKSPAALSGAAASGLEAAGLQDEDLRARSPSARRLAGAKPGVADPVATVAAGLRAQMMAPGPVKARCMAAATTGSLEREGCGGLRLCLFLFVSAVPLWIPLVIPF